VTIEKKITFIIFFFALNTSFCLKSWFYLDYLETYGRIHENKDTLIEQKLLINLATKAALAETKKPIIANTIQQELNRLFNENFKKASYTQKFIYRLQAPFQFAYNNIISQNSNYYFKKLASSLAATAGIAISAFGLYHATRYTHSKLPQEWQEKLINTNTYSKDTLQSVSDDLLSKINLERKNKNK